MMKKIITRALLACLALGAGLTATSCDEDTLSALLGGLFNQGETYSYTGGEKVTVMSDYDGTSYNNALINGAEIAAKSVTFKATQVGNTVSGELALPALTSTGGDVQLNITAATFARLLCTTVGDKTQIATTTETTADGTITVDGHPYAITNLYIDPASYVTQTDIHLTLSIFYGENNEYAVNVEYTGEVIK